MPNETVWSDTAKALSLEKLNTDADIASLEKIKEHFVKVYGDQPGSWPNPRNIMSVVRDASYSYAHEQPRNAGDGHLYSPQFIVNAVCSDGTMLRTRLFRCTLQDYPACCGMKQLNGFLYDGCASEDFVHRCMDLMFDTYHKIYGEIPFRVMMNLVSYQYDELRADRHDLITPIDAKRVKLTPSYPHIHSWAKKQKLYRETLMMNPNTGNIIHHAEVIL